MIEATAPSTLVEELPAPDPEFRVEPQAQLAVIVPSAIEVFSTDAESAVQWSEPMFTTESEDTRSLLSDIVAASQREAERNPGSARTRINLGVALLNAGMLDAAANEFGRARELSPSDLSAIAHLARVRLIQHRLGEARALVQEFKTLDPSSALGSLLSASADMIAGQRESAAASLAEAIRLAPNDWLPEYLLGFLLIGQRDGRQAAAHLRAAARNHPRSAAVQHALGVAFGLQSQWSKAIRAFRQALTLDPRRRETVLAMAHVFLRGSATDDAIELLLNWTAAVPYDREVQELLAHAYRAANNYRSARRHLQIALECVPVTQEYVRDRGRLLNNIGVCAANLGDAEGAVQWYTRSLQAFPTAIAFRNLAQAYRRLDDLESALRVLRAALSHDASDADAKLLSSVIAGELGYADEAIATLNELMAEENAVADVYACLGWILSDEKRDYSAALAVLSRGHERYPGDSVIANNLAYVNLMVGNLKRAREVLDSIPETEIRGSIYLTATLGLLRLGEGDIQGATALYTSAEDSARRLGQTRVARAVRQKMHLELARAYLRMNNLPSAQEHVKRGLAVQGRTSYRDDLRLLRERLLAG